MVLDVAADPVGREVTPFRFGTARSQNRKRKRLSREDKVVSSSLAPASSPSTFSASYSEPHSQAY